MSGTQITLPSGSFLPTERTVYLFQDLTYAAKMGITNNVYTTLTDAYNAANALQISLGGANIVYLKVIGILGGGSGALTLLANFNTNVRIIGESPSSSQIGSINLNNNSGNAYNFGTSGSPIYLSNITTGSILSQSTGVTGNCGSINLLINNVVTGDIINHPSSASNTGGESGELIVRSNDSGSSRLGTVCNSLRSGSTSGCGLMEISANTRITCTRLDRSNPGSGVSGGTLILKNVSVVNTSLNSLTRYVTPSGNAETITIDNCYFNRDVLLYPESNIVYDITARIKGSEFNAGLLIEDTSAIYSTLFIDNVISGATFITGILLSYLNNVNIKAPDSYALQLTDVLECVITNSILSTINPNLGSSIYPSIYGVENLVSAQVVMLNTTLLSSGSGSSIDALPLTTYGVTSSGCPILDSVSANVTLTPFPTDT